MKKYCDKPDRDVPKLKCGYPIPCPFHTVIIGLDDLAVILNKKTKKSRGV